MTNTNFRGPANSLGAMEDATSNVDDGPNFAYQGTTFPDLRSGNFPKDGVGAGRCPAYLDNPSIVTVDNIPSSASTTILAAASTTLSGTGVVLVTVAPGNTTAGVPSVATGVPIIPMGAATPVTAAIALDFGFTTGTTTAASTTVPVVDTTVFTQGQWIAIGGAGNAAKTATLLTQVQAVNATTISIAPAALGTLVNAPIGRGNLWNNLSPPSTQYGPATPVANAVANHVAAGMFRIFDPLGAISRNVGIATSVTTGAAGGVFLVSGWDIYNQAMTERITVAAATTLVAYGKKAFKYIASVVPQFTDTTGTYSVGIGDTFGFPMRMDRYEYLNYAWAGTNNLNSTGFTAPDLTNPAISTTGDVRGTLQVSSNGVGTGVTTATVSNGLRRLFITQTIPVWNDVFATPTNVVPFYGQTQSTT
jgi:hypothetical protein